jgi:hypothetical protein
LRDVLDGRVAAGDLDDDGNELFYDLLPFVGPHPEAVCSSRCCASAAAA